MLSALQQLRERLSKIECPKNTLINNKDIADNIAIQQTKGQEANEMLACPVFLCKFPIPFYYCFTLLDTHIKNSLYIFVLLKSLTKSDRIKFQSIKQIYQLFNYSERTGTRYFKTLSKLNLIEIKNKCIVLKSWQNAIFNIHKFLIEQLQNVKDKDKIIAKYKIKNEKIKRQKIKFICFNVSKLDKKEVKEKLFLQIVRKNIQQQKKQIEIKTKKIVSFANYENIKIEKILKKSVSEKKGAVLTFFENFNKKKESKSFVKYLKRNYSKNVEQLKQKQQQLSNATIYDCEQISRAKDYFCIVITCRNFSIKTGYSRTLVNSLLNQFGFETQKFSIKHETEVKLKKMYRDLNFYQFGHSCMFGRYYF